MQFIPYLFVIPCLQKILPSSLSKSCGWYNFIYAVGTTSYILLIPYVFSPTADQISLIMYCVYVKPQHSGARTSGLVKLLLIIQCKAFQQ